MIFVKAGRSVRLFFNSEFRIQNSEFLEISVFLHHKILKKQNI